MSLKHRLAHLLQWNLGTVVSALDDQGKVWIGFRCAECGEISGIHATHPPPLAAFNDGSAPPDAQHPRALYFGRSMK